MDKIPDTVDLNMSADRYDADFERAKRVHRLTWLPWVGQHFPERPPHKRLLVVGESHYFKSQAEREERSNNPEYTREVVSEALVNLNPECSTPTLDNIPRLLFKTTEIDRRRLWGDSAYHNLVQLLMDNSSKPAKRPTGDDFIAGWLMFAEVVRIIQPSHCLFIGVSSAKTFDISMASQNLSFDKIYRPAHVGGVRPGLAKLEIAGTATKLIFVHHLGWCKSLSQWHEYLQTEHADFMSWLGAESYANNRNA